MPNRIHSAFRLVLLALVWVVVLVGSGLVGLNAYRIVGRINQPRSSILGAVQREYSTISDRVTRDVTTMDQSLLRYAASGNPTDSEHFKTKAAEFKAWIDDRRSFLNRGKLVIVEPVTLTVDVGTLLDQVDHAFTQYLHDSDQVLNFIGPQGTSHALNSFATANDSSLKLFNLASQAHAQAEALNLFLGVSTKWMPSYKRLILVSALVLGSICIWLAGWSIAVVYLKKILPLRMKLVESRTIIEKQEKLAHFGELAAGLAHEIRNPLTAINARLFTLQKSIDEGTAEYEDTMVIHTEIKRLDRIVKEFLKLARPAEPHLAPASAGPLLEEVRDLLLPETRRRSIQFQIDPVVDTQFQADPQQLKQVMINLIQNAAESIGQNGVITLGARDGDYRFKGQNQKVVIIEITDTGPGIPATVQEHLFDPFFSTKDGGTGLGLPISARIVDNHGGALEFQSRVGSGTTFGIILPSLRKGA